MFRHLGSALVAMLLWSAIPTHTQAPNVVVNESTIKGKVDRIERSTRMVTFRKEGNLLQTIHVDPSVKVFDDLRVGDVVTVRYVESTVVQVRPGAALGERDSTAEAQKAGKKDVFEQTTAVVTVENVDPQGLSVTYRTHENRKIMRRVNDKRLLEGIRPGDRVEVTYTRERAVSIERSR